MKTELLFASAAAALLLFAGCSKDEYPTETPVPSKSEIKVNIVGKWKSWTAGDGTLIPTNYRFVDTFHIDGTGEISSATPDNEDWRNHLDVKYSVIGNLLVIEQPDGLVSKNTISSISSEKLDFSGYKITEGGSTIEGGACTFIPVKADYSKKIIGLWECVSAKKDGETEEQKYRIKFLEDGTYEYYQKGPLGLLWIKVADNWCKYFVDGDFIVSKWENKNGEVSTDWLDISRCNDALMEWNQDILNADGTRVSYKAILKRIQTT